MEAQGRQGGGVILVSGMQAAERVSPLSVLVRGALERWLAPPILTELAKSASGGNNKRKVTLEALTAVMLDAVVGMRPSVHAPRSRGATSGKEACTPPTDSSIPNRSRQCMLKGMVAQQPWPPALGVCILILPLRNCRCDLASQSFPWPMDPRIPL